MTCMRTNIFSAIRRVLSLRCTYTFDSYSTHSIAANLSRDVRAALQVAATKKAAASAAAGTQLRPMKHMYAAGSKYWSAALR